MLPAAIRIPFCAFPLDIDRRANANQLVRFLNASTRTGRHGELRGRPRHGLLPDQFAARNRSGLIGILIRGKCGSPEGRYSMNFSRTRSTPSPVSAEMGIISGEIGKFPAAFDDGEVTVFRDAIHLVQKQDARSLSKRAPARSHGDLPLPMSSLTSRIRAERQRIERGVDLSHFGGPGRSRGGASLACRSARLCIGAINDS